jgi:uncharacterized protein YaiI (UPF0178 family)
MRCPGRAQPPSAIGFGLDGQGTLKIWIDADACPAAVKEIVIRAVRRVKTPAVFVANKALTLPLSEYLSSVRVARGLDVADAHIASHALPGDIAVTQDIPLAALLVRKCVVTIDIRGELFTVENIGERLSVRDFMSGLREEGVVTEGPKGFGPRDRQRFAATFDSVLSRLIAVAKQ